MPLPDISACGICTPWARAATMPSACFAMTHVSCAVEVSATKRTYDPACGYRIRCSAKLPAGCYSESGTLWTKLPRSKYCSGKSVARDVVLGGRLRRSI